MADTSTCPVPPAVSDAAVPSVTSAPPPATAPADGEGRLAAIVGLIREADDFPAFSKVMAELMATLANDGVSAQRLANLVLRDYTLTLRVIRTANSVHYNRTGRPVQSASHALMLLGNRAVRDLACGTLLFEQYGKRSPGLKELLLHSLLTASHAREVAAHAGLRDLEAVQMCAMFRNLGEVLVAAHLPREYAEILEVAGTLARSAATGARSAVRGRLSAARAIATLRVLGCSFEDVGVAIARHWSMPDTVITGMRALGVDGEPVHDLIVAFAHDFASAVYREGQASRDAAERAMGTYSRRLRLTREGVLATAAAAVGETAAVFEGAGLKIDDLRLTRQLERALAAPAADAADGAGTSPTLAATSDGAPVVGGAPLVVPAPRRPALVDAAVAEERDRLLAELEAVVREQARGAVPAGTPPRPTPDGSEDRTLLVALEAALRGGPFDHAALCIGEPVAGAPGAVRALLARLVLGADGDALRLRLRVATETNGPLGPAARRGDEVVILRAGHPNPVEQAILRTWNLGALVLIPIAVPPRPDGRTLRAWLYLDRGEGGRVDAPTLGYLRRIAGAVGRALAARPAAPGAGAARMATQPVRAITPPGGPVAVAPLPAVPGEAAATPPREAPAAPSDEAKRKAAAVLRVLRGESVVAVAAELELAPALLEAWHRDFLEGALARLAG